jgi:hypothetical protein
VTTSNVLIAIGLCAVAWYVVSTILICGALRKRGVSVSFVFLRFLILRYASQYREITLKENGKVGPLFYHWIVSINVALVSALVLLLLNIA